MIQNINCLKVKKIQLNLKKIEGNENIGTIINDMKNVLEHRDDI